MSVATSGTVRLVAEALVMTSVVATGAACVVESKRQAARGEPAGAQVFTSLACMSAAVALLAGVAVIPRLGGLTGPVKAATEGVLMLGSAGLATVAGIQLLR